MSKTVGKRSLGGCECNGRPEHSGLVRGFEKGAAAGLTRYVFVRAGEGATAVAEGGRLMVATRLRTESQGKRLA